MFGEEAYTRLASLERDVPALLTEFAYLLKAKDFIAQFNRNYFRSLEIDSVDQYNIEAKFLNTTVHFQLTFTFNSRNRGVGRVLCLNKYQLLNKTYFHKIGEFSFDASGNPYDLGETQNGSVRTIGNSADEIVIGFLVKAFETGPKGRTQNDTDDGLEVLGFSV